MPLSEQRGFRLPDNEQPDNPWTSDDAPVKRRNGEDVTRNEQPHNDSPRSDSPRSDSPRNDSPRSEPPKQTFPWETPRQKGTHKHRAPEGDGYGDRETYRDGDGKNEEK